MRKKIRFQINKILNTVEKALKCAEKEIQEKSQMLFENCITAIESAKITIKLSSDPDKYHVYESCINDIIKSISDKNKNYYNNIDKLRDLINKDITYEIVFMPYKASMWDSMESVWEAASHDKNCICSVIPIPYYDRDSGGNLAKMHYEGDMFPENVPIVNYREYDLNINRPDVIYIHNPYDEYNLISSVSPEFYVPELKKKCEKVVYIPYFIINDDDTNSHFILNPGCVYTDIVVVPSKIVRKRYIDVIKNQLGVERSNNIVSFGSPKIDAVLKNENNKSDIPEGWAEIIKNKKVILYNTHINFFMDNGQKAVDKLEYVFLNFRNRNDIVLLWRPHPLIKTVLKCHKPHLYEEYIRIKKKFNDMEIGIIDETPDVHRAIALSDAYLGDRSSLVSMCLVARKPAMIQSINITESNYKTDRILSGSGRVVIDKKTYLFSDSVNGLFEYDESSGVSKLLAIIPDECMFKEYMYLVMVKCRNKIILVPFAAEYIYEYNINTNKLKRIDLDLKNQKYFSYVESEKYFFFMPYNGDTIVRYNKENEKYETFTDWYKLIRNYSQNKEGLVFTNGAVLVKNSIFVPFYQAPVVLEFNINNFKAVIHKIDCSLSGFGGMDNDGDDFWIIPNSSGAIVKWNYVQNTVVEYNSYPEGFIGSHWDFLNAAVCDEYILAVPVFANMFIKINKKNGDMNRFDLEKNKFLRTTKLNNKLFCSCTADNKQYIIDLQTCDVEIKTIYIPEDFDNVYTSNISSNNNNEIYENSDVTLSGLIDCVVNMSDIKKNRNFSHKNYGEEIHEYVMENIEKIFSI